MYPERGSWHDAVCREPVHHRDILQHDTAALSYRYCYLAVEESYSNRFQIHYRGYTVCVCMKVGVYIYTSICRCILSILMHKIMEPVS